MPMEIKTDAVASGTSVDNNSHSDTMFERLLEALRNPHLVFGSAADPDLVARCELADWEASGASLKVVLERSGLSAERGLKALQLAGELTRQHRIRLEGSPWFCVFEMDDELWARYDIHTSLSHANAAIWDDRFDDILRKNGLDRERFYLRFLAGGPL